MAHEIGGGEKRRTITNGKKVGFLYGDFDRTSGESCTGKLWKTIEPPDYQMVEYVRRRYPAVVEGVVPERVSLARIQKTVAALIAGRVPVNQLDYIISFLEENPEDTGENLAALKEELGTVLNAN